MPNSLEWHLYWFLSCMLHLSTYDICIASFIIMVSVKKSFFKRQKLLVLIDYKSIVINYNMLFEA